MSPTPRAALALTCLSGWLALLFLGRVMGGAVYLLLLAAVVLFPWRSLRAENPPGAAAPPADGPAPGADRSTPST